MSISGRVAVVTGVTGKVGRGIAHTLARQGAKVVGTGRRLERGEELEALVRSEGGELTFVQGDVSKVDDCERLIAVAKDRYGSVDILVNNAASLGDPPAVPSHLASEEWWDTVMDTNLKGTFFCAKHALTSMVEQGSGAIVNLSSVMGLNIAGPPQMAAYTASKAGIIALTKTLAVEYAPAGIRVNAIVVGAAEGDSFYAMADSTARRELGDDYVPPPYEERNSGRMTGEDLAQTVLFLCSEASRHITGVAIAVDQGISAGLMFAARPVALEGSHS